MKIKHLFASAVAAMTLNAANAAQAQNNAHDTETPRGLFTVVNNYNDLKATANTEEFWLLMREIRQSNVGLQGPVARLTLMMDTISSEKYSYDFDAMRHLTICANRDISAISSIVNVGNHYGLRALSDRAYQNLRVLENDTGDKWSSKNCGQVFNAYVPH